MSKLRNWTINKYAEIQSRKEEGQGLAEYGLILALVAVVAVGALGLLSGGINGILGDVGGTLSGAVGA